LSHQKIDDFSLETQIPNKLLVFPFEMLDILHFAEPEFDGKSGRFFKLYFPFAKYRQLAYGVNNWHRLHFEGGRIRQGIVAKTLGRKWQRVKLGEVACFYLKVDAGSSGIRWKVFPQALGGGGRGE